MELTPLQRMIVAAKQQILLYKATHKKKSICQWCFEEPTVEGKTVCQACIDAAYKKEEDDFDLDKGLEEEDDNRAEDTESR